MNNGYAASVAAEVRAEMARQHKSQTTLALDLGVSQAFLSRRLSGGVPFDIDELDRIARVLEVPVTRFLCEEAS